MTRPFPCFTHPFLWISAVLFFSQCSRSDNVDNPPVPPDPDKPFLTITQALPATPFGAQGGSAVLIFSTNEPWRITSETAPESAIDAATWYDIAPPSGDAGGEINVTVKVDPNEEYVGRCFTLILRGETLEERIEVTQAKKNAIIAGDNRLEIGSEERTLTVEVQSNVDYTVSVKEGGEWIEELPESRAAPGLEERTHRFTISANPDAQERTGLIVFKDKASDLFDELTVVQAAWDDPDPERSALRAFYDAAEGGGWTHRENWCSDKPLGEWYGVETDAEGHVTALRLAKNNLAGTVSWEIAKLTKLRHLDLSWNALEGPISVNDGKGHSITCLDDLIELETIDLSHNCIEGGYLPDWAKLNRLQYINLSFNKITSWVATWAHLFQSGRPIDLILNNNYLYGKIPDVIQNHPQWSRIALQCIRQDYGKSGGVSYSKDIHLPDFTFTDLRDGSQGSIREVYSGNIRTMILHWNPLQEDSKTFLETTVRRVHTLFGGQGFAVVAITPEGEEYKQAAEQYLRTHDVPYPVVTDYADAEGHRVILPAEPYPSYFLVDQYGTFSNDMFTGQYCSTSLYPEEPFLIDFMARPFQHTDDLNTQLKKVFGNSSYQSTDFSMDKQFETLQRATKGKGIDIVLIGEAFTDVDIATGYYKQVMEFAMESFFAIEPTKSYREYFNVHMVYAVSRDAYIGAFDSGGQTALGVQTENSRQWFYIYTAQQRLESYYRLPVLAYERPVHSVGIVINGVKGGVTYMREPISGPNFAFTGYVYGGRKMSMGTFIHETAGHAFGLLGDEYSTSGFDPGQPFEIPDYEATRLRNEQKKGWYLNLSLTSDPKSVYWAHLIGHPRYPYVGVLQGGYYYAFGVWRSESYSLMDESADFYFNTICRELIVRRIMALTGEEYTFDKFLAKDSDKDRPNLSKSRSQQTKDQERRHQPPIIGE